MLIISEKIKFNIIGDGSSVGIIESQIKDKKLENITLSKPVNRIQLINLYKNSDVLFLQLNNVKAFEKVLPSKIFEYASFNKPILAGVNGVAREFLREKVNSTFIFEPNNYQDAIEKIYQILSLKDFKISNSKFIETYSRDIIMTKMAKSLIGY